MHSTLPLCVLGSTHKHLPPFDPCVVVRAAVATGIRPDLVLGQPLSLLACLRRWYELCEQGASLLLVLRAEAAASVHLRWCRLHYVRAPWSIA